MPLSYITVLTGGCTLIGTSTNLLVDDMASVAGQARFGIFEITPVGLPMAVAGGLYLFLAGSRLLNATERDDHEGDPSPVDPLRSEEHTSELQSLMRISYAVFCLKNKTTEHSRRYCY